MKLATLCYLKHAGKTLMIHRIKKAEDMNAGKWNGLGGKFLPGETPEACARREFLEESGLTLLDPRLRGFITFPGFSNDEDWYVFVFTATAFRGELIDPEEGVLEWIDDARITSLNLWEGDRIFLPWLEQEAIFSARFTYKDGKLVSHEGAFYGA
jgi:8-oxo-dGTP diphosphatase